MRNFQRIVMGLMLVTVVNSGCIKRTKVSAPVLPGGGKISISVLSDRYALSEKDKATGLNDDQRKNRDQVGEFMEQDIVNMFNTAGYDAKLIQKSGDYTPAPGKYLLKVAIVSYNPGSKAARMLVGYGAGATSQNNHYELIGEGGKTMLSYDDGVGSGRDWHNSARKLNENALKKVTEALSTGQK